MENKPTPPRPITPPVNPKVGKTGQSYTATVKDYQNIKDHLRTLFLNSEPVQRQLKPLLGYIEQAAKVGQCFVEIPKPERESERNTLYKIVFLLGLEITVNTYNGCYRITFL